MFSCRYSVNSTSGQKHAQHISLTWVNSSASQRAISSEASGFSLLVIEIFRLAYSPTLDSSGLKSINSVSSITFVVSTSSTSLFRQLMRLLRAPDATEAG